MSISLKSKPEAAEWPYGLNWRLFLGVDSIASGDIELCADDDSGVTLTEKSITAMTTFCKVSGGTVGKTAKVEHSIVTSAGNKWAESISILIISDCD